MSAALNEIGQTWVKLDKKLDGLKQRFLNLVTNIQEDEINGEEDNDYDQEDYYSYDYDYDYNSIRPGRSIGKGKGSPTIRKSLFIWALPVWGGVSTLARMVCGTYF